MSLRLGPHTLDAVESGRFALDGGAMFGVVPKPLWHKKIPSDERNRIRLNLRCLLIRTGRRVILCDTGIGSSWSDRQRDIYAIDADEGIVAALSSHGVDASEVTDVILTHLHFDHAGGAVTTDAEGKERPTFPRATYHVQRRNWAWAQHPSDRDRGSYRERDFRALAQGGHLHLVEGETELYPGVRLIPSEGHTVGMQLVQVSSDEGWLMYCADLVPTSAHLATAWNMGYDLAPLSVLEEKKMLLAEALVEGGILFFEHDPEVQACRLKEEDGMVVVDKRIQLS